MRLDRAVTGYIPVLAVLLCSLLIATPVLARGANGEVQVGVYNNFPQVFIDDSGTPRGIYVDLLNQIAQQEGWHLEFVPGTFAEGLERVSAGDIDLMTSIAGTPTRDEFIDFSKETVVSVWAQLYVKPDFSPQNLFDMADKKVAVMRSGLLGNKYGELCRDFGIRCTLLPLESYDAALQAVDDGEADAAVVNSLLGFSKESSFQAKRSSIVFSPFRLQVALPEGRNAELSAAIDRHLAAWRQDKNSFYYKTLDRWLGVRPEETQKLPTWFWWGLGGAVMVLIMFVVWTRLLSREVAFRTQEYIESQARYRELIEHMTSGVVIYEAIDDGKDFLFKAFNLGAENIEGISRHELLGKRLTEVFPGVEDFGLLETLRRVWETGVSEFLPATQYQDSHRKNWRENRVFKIPTGEVVALFDDVTRRVEAENELRHSHEELEIRVAKRTEQLQKSEERFRSLVENTHIVAWEVDLVSGLFTYISPHAEELFGFPVSQWTDLDFWVDHIHPDDRKQALSTCTNETAAGRDHAFEYRMLKADGDYIWLRDIVSVLKNDDGIPIAINGFMVDITDRKNFEVELSRSNEELERFAYVASHDLREPLRMVTSYCQLLERQYKGQLDPTADEYIAFAVDGASRMDHLIQDLLDYSRVATRREGSRITPLNHVVDQALAFLQPRIVETDAMITTGPLPTLPVDRSQILRLFQNLIANALTYHQPGVPPDIRIEAQLKGERWHISVTDNGIGIDPEHNDRIFIIFQRLHTSDLYEGTGIGLAVCRKILQLHGGDIWVTSTPGQGSCFTFTLPPTLPESPTT
ncbi:ATP-binding protein [Magnetospira sp. QH-2]|uniref:ATP-binding protein n=1 Tax=Magnetospira sp. (strain QH-2) TaxID=1288970 RepID=UPI0003E80BB4|nr:ATP-binding protein [Magnetospira sp. QH-2]CCQ73130.1 conserved membrane protein of unknown function [PAS domain, histidine kinase domain] [Magnetospira sp. QH-2]